MMEMKKWAENEIVVLDHATRQSILQCPRCGGNNLHQGVVKVFNRIEDGPKVWKTVVDGESVETRLAVSLAADNPSPRRQGMTISFDCEGCGS